VKSNSDVAHGVKRQNINNVEVKQSRTHLWENEYFQQGVHDKDLHKEPLRPRFSAFFAPQSPPELLTLPRSQSHNQCKNCSWPLSVCIWRCLRFYSTSV